MLAVQNLEKSIGNRTVLGPLSFGVESGQVLAIMGANGAGKSTLLRIIAQLSKASAGLVTGQGAGVSMLAHQTYLYNSLTGRENLQFYSSLAGKPLSQQQLELVLDQVGLAWEGDEEVGNYSRGMQQRLALARLWVQDAQVVLLDEPQTGLDQAGLQILQSMLESWKQAEKTILLVTHAFDELFKVVDELLILDRGSIGYLGECPGSPEEVKELYNRSH